MAVQSGVYRGVSAEDRAAQRRTRLVEAAITVWADTDARTTMTGICAAAGLTERYFYESFDNLDDALSTVLDVIATEIEETANRAADAVGDDPRRRIDASIRAFVRLIAEDPRKGRVALIQSTADPRLRQRRTELMRHFARRAAEEGRLLPGASHRSERDQEMAGLLFIGGMAELITAWLDGVLEATPEEIVDAAARSFLGLHG